MRHIFALSLSMLLLTSGCTTSRAVRAWHAGIKAEDAGNLRVARARYNESYGRNSAHVGAELARLRLLARVKESRKRASKRLTELLKKKGDRPDVLIFAAWWALLDGDLALARERAAAVSISKQRRDREHLQGELRRLQARLRQALTPAQRAQRQMQWAKYRLATEGGHTSAGPVSDCNDLQVPLLRAMILASARPHWAWSHNLAVCLLQRGELDAAGQVLKVAAQRCEDCQPIKSNLAVLGE